MEEKPFSNRNTYILNKKYNMSLKIAIIINLCSQKNAKNNNFNGLFGEIAKSYFK